MQRTLTLHIEPLSVNSTYYGNRGHGKTASSKQWFCDVFSQLALPSNNLALRDLREFFKSKEHAYCISLIFEMPRSRLYTKTGELSSKVTDLTNIEKSLVDAIFLPKYFGPSVPYECENLNIDDRYLWELHSSKRPSADGSWHVRIEVRIVSNKSA